MIQTLLDDIKVYFNTIENPTTREQQLKQRLSEGYFPITSVHRNDLVGKGFDVEKISDADMKILAKKMANDYCEQLFWPSMEIIAGEILNFPRTKDATCPKCNSKNIRYDINESRFHCDACSQTWDDKLYVLVEFPEGDTPFEEEENGNPIYESKDNGVLYVSEEDYIRHTGEYPDYDKCYRIVCWPESQKYTGVTGCEPIQDENAI